MKKIIITNLLVLGFVCLHAQKKHEKLEIGDQVPNMEFTSIKNYDKKTLRLSDFKGKLIIIDFWNKGCGPCIEAFPKMEHIEQEFKDKVKVLLVTYDKKEDLSQLFNSSSIIKSLTSTFIMGDSILSEMFPHKGVPYHVWIDQNGFVRKLTDGANTTLERVKLFLSGTDVDLPDNSSVSDQSILYLPFLDQLFYGGSKQRNQLETYSLIMKKSAIDSRGSLRFVTLDSMNRDLHTVGMLNNSIPQLFTAAYIGFIRGQTHMKTIIEAKDQSKYYRPKNSDESGDWNKENLYCYEYKYPTRVADLPPNEKNQWISKVVIEDLERYFMITSHLEKRKMKSYVLTAVDRNKILPSKVKDDVYVYEIIENRVKIRNLAIHSSLQALLQKYYMEYATANEIPFFDESGISYTLDMDLEKGNNLEDLNKQLAKYGLEVKEEIREVECLIITEK